MVKDITGMRFNRLIVEGFSHKNKHNALIWNVVCDCGNRKQVSGSNLRGNTQSCGCLKKEQRSEQFKTHGKSGTKTHKIWKGILSRCYIKSASGYIHYGGRDVSVCERWHTFDNFLADMGECPDGLSIERKDVNGNYELNNCFWATRIQQANNRRNNRILKNTSETLVQASEKNKITYNALRARLNRGWNEEDTLNKPINHKIGSKTITANGETKTIAEWAHLLNISPRSIRLRIEAGWSEEIAVTTPKGAK